jgi:hydrogenase maturation factor
VREISITIDQTESLNTLAILSTVIGVVAIGWVIAQLLTTRRRLRNGDIVVPPLVCSDTCF